MISFSLVLLLLKTDLLLQVSYLQNDNALLENKQKEVKGTINGLLQSRDDLISAYQVHHICMIITSAIFLLIIMN